MIIHFFRLPFDEIEWNKGQKFPWIFRKNRSQASKIRPRCVEATKRLGSKLGLGRFGFHKVQASSIQGRIVWPGELIWSSIDRRYIVMRMTSNRDSRSADSRNQDERHVSRLIMKLTANLSIEDAQLKVRRSRSTRLETATALPRGSLNRKSSFGTGSVFRQDVYIALRPLKSTALVLVSSQQSDAAQVYR